jgi:hypothetical protein
MIEGLGERGRMIHFYIFSKGKGKGPWIPWRGVKGLGIGKALIMPSMILVVPLL